MNDARTDGGDGGDDFAQLELVEDGGLAGGVQADCQQRTHGESRNERDVQRLSLAWGPHP